MPSLNFWYIISGILFAVFFLGICLVSTMIYQNVKSTFKTRNYVKDNQNRVKKFKEDGGIHKWVNLAIRMPNGKIEETHVCEHTGYCPAFEGFVDLDHVKDIVRERKVAKEFEEYKREKLLDWADEYCVGDIKSLYDKMIGLKQAFHVQKMEKELGTNVKIVTNMKELDKALEEIKESN